MLRRTISIKSITLCIATILFTTQINALTGNGPLCLSCDRVVNPHDCHHVLRCGVHEECSVQKYISDSTIQWFDVGCQGKEFCHARRRRESNLFSAKQARNSDLQLCQICCNGTDVCNNEGCGAVANPLSKGLLKCYECSQHKLPDQCDQISLCDVDQECYIGLTSVGADVLYTTGCMAKNACIKLQGSGSAGCCSTSFCNDQTPTAINYFLTSPPPPITTTTGRTSHSHHHSHHDHNTHDTTCRAKWMPFGGSEYCLLLHNTHLGWNEAKLYCENHFGGHLPIGDTEEKLHFIEDLLLHYQHNDVWLDGTDSAREGHWIWSSSGKPVDHRLWMHSQPDGHTDENCMEFGPRSRTGNKYKYFDSQCDSRLSVLCERNVTH